MVAQLPKPQVNNTRKFPHQWVWGVAFFSCLLTMVSPGVAQAASDNTTNTVTIKVLQHLSITEDVGDFTLTFDAFTKGAFSNKQVVNYRLKSNSMPLNALDGVVSAHISETMPGIELQAKTGPARNVGSNGNIRLLRHHPGFVKIGTSAVELAKKGATTGRQGRVLNAEMPISWRAEALEDLASGTYTTQLTVTLKDS